MRKIVLHLYLTIISVNGYSQDSFLSKVMPALGKSIPENVYLHLDKSIYLTGDTIWFKGYIMKGSLLSDNSTSLHVELFDKRGYLMLVKMFPVFNGITVGQVEIPTNTSSDVYYLRAYTKWECNFDTRHLYQVPVTILDSKSNNVGVLKQLHRNRSLVVSYSDSIYLTGTNSIKGPYFNISSDENGPWIDSVLWFYFISPKISSNTSFILTKNKLSKEILFPVTAQIAGHEIDLVLLSGSGEIIMQDKFFFPPGKIAVDIFPDTLNTQAKGFNCWRVKIDDSVSTLSVSITDAEIDTNRINISNSISSTMIDYRELLNGKLPDDNLIDSNYLRLRGIAKRASKGQIIKNKKLLAFITTKDSIRDFQVIPIDSAGRFDLKNMMFYDTATIQFQLQDRKFRAKDVGLWFDWFSRPLFYPDSNVFQYTKRTELQKTDLMKITQRKENLFAYDKIGTLAEVTVTAKKKSTVEKMDEEYATGAFRGGINSRSFDMINDNSALGVSLTMFMQSRVPSIEIKKDGMGRDSGLTYRRDGLVFFLNEWEVSYDQIAGLPLGSIAYVKFHPPPFVGAFLMKGAVCVYTKKGSELETPDPTLLKEVIVRRRASNKKLDKAYTSGLFSMPADFSLDLRLAVKEFDLFQYLSEKLPGFSYRDMGMNTDVKYFNKTPIFFIDEWEDPQGMQVRMYRYRVNFLAYVKVIPNYPVAGSFVPAIVIYTRKGEDIAGAFQGLNKTLLPGYDRIYFPQPPDYSDSSRLDYADNRITLYWNPLIGTGEHIIRFYNNDYTKKFKITIEGIGRLGELLHFEKIIE